MAKDDPTYPDMMRQINEIISRKDPDEERRAYAEGLRRGLETLKGMDAKESEPST